MAGSSLRNGLPPAGKMDLTAFGVGFGFGDLDLSEVGGNAVITVENHGTITVIGVAQAQIDASDFIFAV